MCANALLGANLTLTIVLFSLAVKIYQYLLFGFCDYEIMKYGCIYILWTDADVEKPQAKKRKTEDSGSAKSAQNGKKRKRDDENEVRYWFVQELSEWRLFWKNWIVRFRMRLFFFSWEFIKGYQYFQENWHGPY